MTANDLPLAKRVLSGFDFLLDVSNVECNHFIYDSMGLKNQSMPVLRTHNGTYNDSFLAETLEDNLLDIELVKFAQEIIDLDCAYFSSLVTNLRHVQCCG